MAHNPISIANHFIEESDVKLTLMHVLRLSYIAHGFTLAFLDKPLADENVEAWIFGPTFPSIYEEFKSIDRVIKDLGVVPKGSLGFNAVEKSIMNTVFNEYGDMDGWRLSLITHEEGTPWDKFQNIEKDRKVIIKNELIKKYFIEKLKTKKVKNEA